MATKSDLTKQAAELLQMGGMKLPAGFAAKSVAATKSILRKEFEAGIGTRMQGAKLYGALNGASPVAVKDPSNEKALEGLSNWHKKLAGKRLPIAQAHQDLGGIIPWRISGTVVPPFDF